MSKQEFQAKLAKMEALNAELKAQAESCLEHIDIEARTMALVRLQSLRNACQTNTDTIYKLIVDSKWYL